MLRLSISGTRLSSQRFFTTTTPRMVSQIASAADFRSKIGSGLVLVEFFATWCGPCKMIAPVLENFEKQYTNVSFYKVDIEQVAEIASEFAVSAVPTIILFKEGEQVDVVKGANAAKVKQILDARQ
ncbi:Thioredoxin-2 [Wickerhamiella sorbophila]|uniref:Thioredoxin-2 n=1 Tax=Wickerhamiella sorbophila TaxID=45607 RepID=A0A2T0FF03_9ASCO|nr:Thioredoxin-2 [Wickerhamiella sorbophila]PRT53550.1 Thioredoxin-2 [Wickerhamiella sorbophila]